eukprot:TRINITY_DN23_c0_g1_i1.p1 TRINITY_DN23_c0_g1~~TRINITY_DN23_c0_g1_i1.p1  ORF type:complete len:736 (+),score=197.62 TRINITY_DN23_c0_g1_i1:50-2257(+)
MAARKQHKLDEVWPMLVSGIEQMLVKLQSINQTAWMEMYSGVYNLCISRHEKELYDTFKEWITKHCQNLYRALAEYRKVELLQAYLKTWSQFTLGIQYVHKIFDYLHRYWVPKNKQQHGAEEITTLALNTFREKSFSKLKDHLLDGLLDQITRERKGEKVDHALLREVINSYVKLGTNKNNPLEVYKADFERAFIAKTKEFYAAESSEYLASNGCALYMTKVDNRIAEENARVKSYLDGSTETDLMEACDEVLITAHKESFQTDFRSFLETDRKEDLGRMYKLLQRLKDGLGYIKSVLKSYTSDMAENELKLGAEKLPKHSELRKSPEVVEGFVKLNDRCQELVNNCFAKNADFMKAVDEAFIGVTNKQIGVFQMAELLAFYADYILRGTVKMSDEEMEKTFDKISKQFTYLSDKDLFHAFYRRGLSRRLLAGKTNEDGERSMIARFKEEYGAYFTAKLEGMINDMNTSSTIRQKFKDDVKEERLNGISMDVQVLNSLHWPIYKSEGDQIKLPKELVECQKAFDEFYQKTTQNRKLTWVYAHSQAQVQLKYGKQKFDLMCTTYQACIMLQFNASAESLPFNDIKSALGLSNDDLAMCIEPLCGLPGKYQIIKKTGDEKQVGFEDDFSWNDDLPKTKPPRRITVPPTSGRANRQETTTTNKAVQEERKYKIDAAIVRIMKARRRLHINDLMAEVMQQLLKYFKPEPKMIKRCIESLIEREYLDREEDDTNTFRYLA